MAAHRYWALQPNVASVDTGSGTSYVFSVAEIEMRATAGGADLCSGGAVWSAGGWINPPANAFDDNASTYALIQGFQWSILIGYVFAAATTIREVAMTLPGSAAGYAKGSNSGPYMVTVWGSDNGSVWRAYATADTSAQRSDGAVLTIAVPNAVPAQVSSTQAHARAVGSGSFSPSATIGCINQAAANVDPRFGGPYRISGDVAISGSPDTPVSRRVRLFDRDTGMLVRETWSDPTTGAYVFTGLAPRTYLAVADDHTAIYNAAVADRLVPVL